MSTITENALCICAAACLCTTYTAIVCAILVLISIGTSFAENVPTFISHYLSFVYQPDVFLDFDVVLRLLFSVVLFFILFWACSIMFKSYEFLNNYPSSLFLFFALSSNMLYFATEIFVFADHFGGNDVLYLSYPVLFPFVERLSLAIPLISALFSVVLQLHSITSRLSSEHIFFSQPSGLPKQSYSDYLHALLFRQLPAAFARRIASDKLDYTCI